MQVTFKRKRFECECAFAERFIPRTAGFSWDSASKRWYTVNPLVASRLRQYLDSEAASKLNHLSIQIVPWAGPLSFPEHLKIFPFQEQAARFALSRNRSYLGLDPGLGKTIVAALIHAALKRQTVYVCPPFLVANTTEEFLKWGAEPNSFAVVSDTMITRPPIRFRIKQLARDGATLIVDEAHRFKNMDAKRSKAIYSLVPMFKRSVFMSGTPMPNRPIELYPVLSTCAPETIDFMTRTQYGYKFCDLKQTFFGMDFSGACNMDNLRERIVGPFMIRMRKEDVLEQLPEKLEEMVILSQDLPPKLDQLDRKILRLYSPVDLMKQVISAQKDGGEALHLSTYRKELGLAKVKESAKFIESILEETEDSVLVFAIHSLVIQALGQVLKKYDPFTITGATPMQDRQTIVKSFQTRPERRLFIGNIQACGTGFTLTKATRVVFVEYSWAPTDNSQASDRAHRIGQKNPVLCQYLVFRNSVDRAVLEVILNKQDVIAKI